MNRDTLTAGEAGINRLLLTRGGPFFELQKQLGLLREDAFRGAPAPGRRGRHATTGQGNPRRHETPAAAVIPINRSHDCLTCITRCQQ